MEVILDPERAAIPGFHIHLAHPVFAEEVATTHRDLQFRDVFPAMALGAHEVLTFTLPISAPAQTGINFWKEGHKVFHPYLAGWMLVHSGLETHQAVLYPLRDDVPRIMLQGHGAVVQGRLLIYW
jgi:hypothetical protein